MSIGMGVQDEDEPGLGGVRLELFAGRCEEGPVSLVQTATTSAVGKYFFSLLAAGSYCLVVDEATLPLSYTLTSGTPIRDVALAAGEIRRDMDFGYSSIFASDRLNVNSYTPCNDISWLQRHAANHDATILSEDYATCHFTLAISETASIGIATTNMTALMAELSADEHTRAVEPDVFVRGTFDPNDPAYGDASKVYAPQQIKAPAAWDLTLGDPELIVAVVDTGIDLTHPEFAGRIMAGYDFVNDDADPSDDNGHGTHVAGIIAAGIDNGLGIAGIAGRVRILPVKVLNTNNGGWLSKVAEGIIWAVNQGARVINLSLIGSVDSPTLHDAINYATSHGVFVVAAAGNAATDVPLFPASYDELLAVAATTYTAERWSLSNYGPDVDVMAPGATIYSTFNDGGYRFLSGTSMASPHVAGVAALMLSRNPNLTPATIKRAILETAVSLDDPYRTGYGLIDAGAAVAAVRAQNYITPRIGLNVILLHDLSENGIVDPGDTLRFVNGNDTVIRAVRPDQTNLACPNTIIDAVI